MANVPIFEHHFMLCVLPSSIRHTFSLQVLGGSHLFHLKHKYCSKVLTTFLKVTELAALRTGSIFQSPAHYTRKKGCEDASSLTWTGERMTGNGWRFSFFRLISSPKACPLPQSKSSRLTLTKILDPKLNLRRLTDLGLELTCHNTF